jgi:dTDP-glucose 4,6-dehydratase
MTKIFVTGAAGFIGSNFVRLLTVKKPDWQIIAYDNLTYAGNLANIKDLIDNQKLQFVKGDICDHETVTKYLPGCTHLLNFAAESHVDRSILSAADFIRTNIEGTRVLLEEARAANIQKFIQISTDEVYGSLGKTGAFTETTPLHPNSPYSASKASADLLALAYQHTFDMPVIVTRCSNNYGPYQFPEKLIPLFVTNLLEDKKVPVYGDGRQIRDWIHVHDHCTAILAVLEKGRIGQVYNIGSDNEQYNIDITKMILQHLNKDQSYIKHVTDRPGHDRRYAIDSTKMHSEIGWKAQIEFSKGLKDTIEWYLENKKWWQAIKSGDYMNYYKQQYAERFGENQ